MVFTKNERIVLIALISGFSVAAAIHTWQETIEPLPKTAGTIHYEAPEAILSTREEAQCVNINFASEQGLSVLPGIGPVIARRIVAYRETNGPFTDFESVKNVRGIGQKTLNKIKPFITIALKEDS